MLRARPELSPAGHDIPDSALTKAETYVQLGVVIAVVFTAYLWWGILYPTHLTNSISQLDVGQGDATFITLTSLARDAQIRILYDAGGGRAVLHALDALGNRSKRIDLLIVSHPHLDHYGGFVPILERYDVGALITNGYDTDEETFKVLIDALAARNIPVITLGEGDQVRYGEHIISILSPDPTLLLQDDLNEASLVALLKTGAPAGLYRALLTGDIGIPTETMLMDKGYELHADVLKVGHHGSRFSSSEQFIATVRPRIALIGVGQNRFGHPAPRVLETLALAGTSAYRTDTDGTITIALEETDRVFSQTRSDTDSLIGRVWSLLTGAYTQAQPAQISLHEQSEQPFSLVAFETCTFKTEQSPTHDPVLINEVAWMGATSGATHEWIELRNISGAPIDLSGWQLMNENGRVHVTFPQQQVFSQEYLLLARSGARDALGLNEAIIFSGVIRNSNEGLRLYDHTCALIDEVHAGPNWPAGDNASKQTMMRTETLTWAMSRNPDGSPGSANTFVTPVQTSPTVSAPSNPHPTTSATTGCPPHGININTAPANELTQLRHIGVARANDIITARPFTSVSDLSRVRGLGGTRVADIIAEGRACVE